MPVALVDQLYFTRESWRIGLTGLTEREAETAFDPQNSISWMVGHLAAHEQTLWLKIAQGHELDTTVNLCRPGQPAVNPPYDAMLAAWEQIIVAANTYLDALTPQDLQGFLTLNNEPMRESIGTMLHRLIYHYWYHLGELQAIRQQLGHTDLPQFIGRIPESAQYRINP